MKKGFDEIYNQIINQINISGKENSLISLLTELREKYVLLEQRDKDNQINKKILRHELRNPLGNIGNVIDYIQKNYKMGEKELLTMLGYGGDNLNILKELVGLLDLEDSSLEDIYKYSDELNLESVINRFWRSNSVRTVAENSDKKIYDEIGISVNYSRHLKDIPIKIYSNPTMTDIYLGIVLGNSLSYSLPDTIIKQQIIENKDNLSILLENATQNKSRVRDGGGLGKQLGIPYAKTLLEKLGGKLEIYDNKKRINSNLFDVQEKFGKVYDTKDYPEFFGIQINVPKNPFNLKKTNG